MRRFLILVALALAAVVPALVLRATGWRPSPILDAAAFGSAILAAGFLLSWGAETAEQHIAQGLILAVVALVTVLPEYAVDLYYAYKAGLEGPQSQYVHYAAANMTGANRLLVGLAWPLMVFLHWIKDRHRAIDLAPANATEIGFLLLPSLYAFVILFKRSISVLDFAVLATIFGAYVWRVRNLPKSDNSDETEEPGPAAALNTLSPAKQWAAIGALVVVACGVILISAEPFAEAMVSTGRAIGLNEFLLIQWLAPLASEAPAVSVAVLFVLANRAGNGLTALISDKINQWTLLVGMLPLALSVGARGDERPAARRATGRGVLPDGRAIALRHRAALAPAPRAMVRAGADGAVCRAGRAGLLPTGTTRPARSRRSPPWPGCISALPVFCS